MLQVVIGPATVGGIQAGAFKIGDTAGTIDNIIQSKLYRPGSVGFVSKSVCSHSSAFCLFVAWIVLTLWTNLSPELFRNFLVKSTIFRLLHGLLIRSLEYYHHVLLCVQPVAWWVYIILKFILHLQNSASDVGCVCSYQLKIQSFEPHLYCIFS